MQTPDFILENANLIDGTGAPARKTDVAIAGERIVAVASPLPEDFKRAAKRIDLAGKTLTPGFIDVHAHGELEPLADNSAAGKIAQGVTTEISGNCGLTPFPLLGALRTEHAMTVLHVTHNRAEAELLGDLILRFEDGRIL